MAGKEKEPTAEVRDEEPQVPGALEEESLLDELAEICEAIEIESASAFTFAGHRFDVPAVAAPDSVAPGGAAFEPPRHPGQNPLPLLHLLQQVLYGHCYSRRFDVEDPPELDAPSPAPVQPDSSFVERLFAAVDGGGGGRMDTAWQVVAIDPWGRVTASKNGWTRVFPPGHYTPAGALHPGGQVSVWLAKGSLNEQDGFFYVHSERISEEWVPQEVVRIYWNLTSEGAPEAVGGLVRRLDRFRLPYALKTLTLPDLYEVRNDGTVLFGQRRHFPITARLCLEVAAALDRGLTRAQTPLFTHPLAPGLALAEDPGTSFGLSRCRMLAEALWNAHCQGQDDTVGGQLDEVRRHFARRGVDLECPHLNPHSVGLYDLPCTEEGP